MLTDVNRLVALTAPALLLLTSCTVTTAAPATSPAPVATSTPSAIVESDDPLAPTPAASPSVSPASTAKPKGADDRLALGETWKGESNSLTVLKFDREVTTPIDDSPRMEAALVKACVTDLEEFPNGISFSDGPWEVYDADGGRYEPTTWDLDKPTPIYPDGSTVYQLDECTKGWILFESYKQGTVTLRYNNEQGELAKWKLPS